MRRVRVPFALGLAALALAGPAQAAPAPAGALTLTQADRDAAMRAAGFQRQGGTWKRCEDPGTPSYTPGAIAEVVDLNADGRPEAVITEGGSFCFGNTGQNTVIVSKGPSGAWTTVLDQNGIFVAMPSRVNGWLEVEIGGPGFTQPVYRFNGKAYVFHRTIRE